MSNLIKSAQRVLTENSVDGSLANFISALEQAAGFSLIRIPGVEDFTNSKESGVGIRFIFDRLKAIRFNWKSESDVSKGVESMMSIDIWNGSGRDPARNIHPEEGKNFGDSIDALASAIKGHSSEPEPERVAPKEPEQVEEGKKGEFTHDTALSDFIRRLRMGKTFTRGDFIQFYHNENVDIFDALVNRFSNQITMTGKRVGAKRGTNWEQLKKDVLAAASDTGLIIDDGGNDEMYGKFDDDGGVSFTDSLKHLKDLTLGVAKGTFNALFVGGKGGTGKTQTVEDSLAEAGLRQGSGYYKVTGSATASGIYTLLYQNHDGIILFDDSDSAFDDQESRNIFKAATDTKKVRRLTWQKAGGAITAKDGRKIPPAFNFEGRIIVVSNLSLDKLDPDKALRTRGFVIIINPTNDEMVNYMKDILPKIEVAGSLNLKMRQKVFTVVKDLAKTNDVNLRTLVRALNLAASGVPNWVELVKLYA